MSLVSFFSLQSVCGKQSVDDLREVCVQFQDPEKSRFYVITFWLINMLNVALFLYLFLCVQSGCGRLSVDDLREACVQFQVPTEPELLEQLLDTCDVDRDGRIDYLEFSNFLNWKDKTASGFPDVPGSFTSLPSPEPAPWYFLPCTHLPRACPLILPTLHPPPQDLPLDTPYPAPKSPEPAPWYSLPCTHLPRACPLILSTH